LKLILYSSKKCKVCIPLRAKLKEIAKELKVELREVEIEENPQEAAQKLIFSAPTVILEVDGREIKRWSGIFSVDEVKKTIERFKN